MVGPSASGSLNGTPTSTKSAPAAWTSWSAASDASGVGWPAVRYGMSAARRRSPARRVRQRAAIGCSDKVIADVDAVLGRIGDLDDDRIVAAARVLPHLLEHLVGLDRHGLIHAPARGGVEAVGHRHDFGIDREVPWAQRLGVAREIGLHVVLVGDDHAAIGDLAVAAQPEQRQHAEPGVRLHDAPLLVGQAALLVEDLERHAGLADVVEQRRHPQVVQLQLGEAELAAQGYREDAHVHRVGERVLVVIAQRREADERRLVVEHLVHDRLDRPLHLLHVRGAAHPDGVDDLLGDGHRAGVGALGGLLLALLFLDVLVGLERRLDTDEGNAPVRELLAQLEHLVGIRLLGCVREQQGHEDLQLSAVHAFVHAHRPDAALPQHAEDVGERGVVIEVEPQAGGVHEQELALQPQLQLLLDVEQMLGRRRQVVQRLLHLGVLDGIELERAERGVQHHEELAARVAQEAVGRLDRLGDRRLPGRAAAAHPPTSRSARLTALRTSGSLSCAARSSTARASGVRTFPSAMAAQARVSGSAFLPSSPLAASIFSSTGTPRAPTSEPNASKNVIFSVKSAFLSFEPVTMLSTRGAALRWPREARNRTAATRTSRSASSITFSSRRIALGLAMAVRASTTASLSDRSLELSSGSIPSGAPGSLSRPASLTISSWAALSSLASAFSTSPALACARRAAAPCTSSRTRSLLSRGSHPISVTRASARSS